MPDVVVLDVHMPEMDGFEVVARLKEDPVTESIPVVFLTGDPPTDELVVRGLELGAYDFLSKGCSKAELLARVSVMDRIKRSHDELSAIAQISDALLRSVDPETLARQFIAEARNVFRADAAVLAIERRGDAKVRVWDGLDVEDGVVVAMLKAVGSEFGEHDTAESRILDGDDVARVIEPHLGDRFNTCGIACVRRDPSTALVVVLAEQPRLLRGDVDGPLLKNLSSQAAIAIEHALLNERARQQAEDLERAMTER
ncbi:MAG: response regulator, partial [Gemmatimonadota bacterium]